MDALQLQYYDEKINENRWRHYSVALKHSTSELFYDLTTLSNTKLEHAQSHQHLPVEWPWVWSINHGHGE